MIIKHNSSKINPYSILSDFSIQKIYQDQIDTINLNDFEGHSWHIHGYYKRSVSFLGECFRIRIRRISSVIDGIKVTHALLIDDFVPFLSLSFHDLKAIITSLAVIFSPSHSSYILSKFAHFSDLDYKSISIFLSRSCSVIFIDH